MDIINNSGTQVRQTDRDNHRRAMMIWRQMINIYGGAWTSLRGPRCKFDGSLTYVAKTWVLALGGLSDINIRRALNELAENPGQSPISIFDFRDKVKKY